MNVKKYFKFYNIFGSIYLTLICLFILFAFIDKIIYDISVSDVKSAILFIVIFVLLIVPAELIMLHICCWRFVFIDGNLISHGGFLRIKTTINILEIENVKYDTIIVYHGTTINLVEEVYVISSREKEIPIPVYLIPKDLMYKLESFQLIIDI